MIKSYKLRRGIANALIYIALAVMGLIWIFPLVWLVAHSFRVDPMAVFPLFCQQLCSLRFQSLALTTTSVCSETLCL